MLLTAYVVPTALIAPNSLESLKPISLTLNDPFSPKCVAITSPVAFKPIILSTFTATLTNTLTTATLTPAPTVFIAACNIIYFNKPTNTYIIIYVEKDSKT